MQGIDVSHHRCGLVYTVPWRWKIDLNREANWDGITPKLCMAEHHDRLSNQRSRDVYWGSYFYMSRANLLTRRCPSCRCASIGPLSHRTFWVLAGYRSTS